MSSRGICGRAALALSFAALGSLPACGDDGDDAPGGTSGSGGTGSSGGTGGVIATGGSSATGSSGGSSGSGGAYGGTGGSAAAGRGGTGGSGASVGSGGKGGPAGAAGRAAGSGGKNGAGGAPEPQGGGSGDSPYEIECHGDTVTCGDPASLLCLGLRVESEVFGYSCSNECQSDADCSDAPSSTDAAAGCVDFVNKKYCLLVCKDGDEQASCPNGMYCYVYEGSPIGYCLWR
jgi:hypothetical protein